LEIHTDVGGDAPGKRYGLEVLNKSAIVLISAVWEAYCEDIALEAAKHLAKHLHSASALPLAVQKRVASELKMEKHELAILRLSGNGWRQVVEQRAQALTAGSGGLNTPKTQQINDLFEKAIGLNDVSAAWKWKKMTAANAGKKLDSFVTLRGAIAHRGVGSKAVKKADVLGFFNHVTRLVAKTGGQVNKHVKAATGRSLW
jgi:hypothetical protein